jgi:hypothetical protein
MELPSAFIVVTPLNKMVSHSLCGQQLFAADYSHDLNVRYTGGRSERVYQQEVQRKFTPFPGERLCIARGISGADKFDWYCACRSGFSRDLKSVRGSRIAAEAAPTELPPTGKGL